MPHRPWRKWGGAAVTSAEFFQVYWSLKEDISWTPERDEVGSMMLEKEFNAIVKP